MKKGPEQGLISALKVALQRHFFQHFDADLAGGNFTQGGDSRLVFAFNLRRVTLAQHASAIGRSQHQLETVGDLLETVFDGDAGHGILRNYKGMLSA
jgi:hypothetical protein